MGVNIGVSLLLEIEAVDLAPSLSKADLDMIAIDISSREISSIPRYGKKRCHHRIFSDNWSIYQSIFLSDQRCEPLVVVS